MVPAAGKLPREASRRRCFTGRKDENLGAAGSRHVAGRRVPSCRRYRKLCSGIFGPNVPGLIDCNAEAIETSVCEAFGNHVGLGREHRNVVTMATTEMRIAFTSAKCPRARSDR